MLIAIGVILFAVGAAVLHRLPRAGSPHASPSCSRSGPRSTWSDSARRCGPSRSARPSTASRPSRSAATSGWSAWCRRAGGQPQPGRPERSSRTTSTASGRSASFRQMIEDTRRRRPGRGHRGTDDGRQFYQLHPFKRIVIMFAGPFMNLILAVFLFGIILVGIGVPTAVHPTVQAVQQCVLEQRRRPTAAQLRRQRRPVAGAGRRAAGERHVRLHRRRGDHRLGPAEGAHRRLGRQDRHRGRRPRRRAA